MSKLIALCIGHSRIVNGHQDGGAVALDHKTSEWIFNSELAKSACAALADLGIPATIISRYEGIGYEHAQEWLAGELKRLDAGAALELHFNDSDNPASNGHEFLFWHGSTRGNALATALDKRMDLLMPMIRHRDLVAITGTDRGAAFLRGTPCPAVIVESFFGSNHDDFENAVRFIETLAKVIALGIRDWLAA